MAAASIAPVWVPKVTTDTLLSGKSFLEAIWVLFCEEQATLNPLGESHIFFEICHGYHLLLMVAKQTNTQTTNEHNGNTLGVSPWLWAQRCNEDKPGVVCSS